MHKSLQLGPVLIITTLILASCGGGGSGNAAQIAAAGTGWTIPPGEVVDGGPGRDGIPALENPIFESAATIQSVGAGDYVIVVRYGDEIRAYPHDIMNWHEVANDGDADNPFTMSYCPLTGSAMVWQGDLGHANPSFGTSGFLYNSNLILFDRETKSNWSQMLQQSVNGIRLGEQAEQFQVVETLFSTLRQMYPDAKVMNRNTGITRDYDDYPYGSYLTSVELFFPISNPDNRLHPKNRVIGIHSDGTARAYQITAFDTATQVINDQIGNLSIVVVGNSNLNIASIYNRALADGTILNFSAIEDGLPNVLLDDEGNTWDIFGKAVSGPRAGEQLAQTESYTSFWFAWATFFPGTELHFNPT